MATQLADAPADNGGEQDNHEVNFEAEASKMGWKPVEEFKGDPAKHVDAKTFYERGQVILPLVQAQNKALLTKIANMERDMKRSAEFFSKAEERAYERARDDLKREMADAVEAGDTSAANAVLEKLDKLEKPGAQQAKADDSDRAEEFADWATANRWYGNNDVMRIYADAQAEKIAKGKGGVLDRADLDSVADAVKAKFEEAYPEAFATKPAAREQRRSPVDGGGNGVRAPRAGKTFNDLPPEAQRICDKWVGNGTIKSREDYIKNYQW